MGSSVKKKREKKKDFQVSISIGVVGGTNLTDTPPESKAQGWKDSPKSSQYNGHELQVQVSVVI